jgi:pentatricopeptide repeat protein
MGTIDDMTDSKPPKLQPQGKRAQGFAPATYAAPTTCAAPATYVAATGDLISCNALISACAKDKRLESALHIFKAMQQQGILPNQFTYNALITACKEANHPGLTLEVFRILQATTSWSVPQTFSYQVAPTAAAYPAAKSVTRPTPVAPPAKSAAPVAAKPAARPADKPEAMFGQPSLSVPGLWPGYDIKLTADNTKKPVRQPTMEERIMTMKQVAWENPAPTSAKAKPQKTGFCF